MKNYITGSHQIYTKIIHNYGDVLNSLKTLFTDNSHSSIIVYH